jgi:fructokinase
MFKPSQKPLFRIGIDLGGTKIEAVLLGPDGRLLARERIATPRGDYDGTLAAVAGLVERMKAAPAAAGAPPPTVGVAIPGALSPATGLVKNANSTWLIGRPLDRDLEARLGQPVRLANDANCFAVSEAVDGAGTGAAVVFGVILGTGVGGGIAIDGRPLRGANAIAGEWGHNPLPAPRPEEQTGPGCYCGRRGCVETWLSGPALEAQYQAATGRLRTATEIAAAARAGEEAAEQALVLYEERLARALGHVINLLDPDVIVLGGGLSGLARLYRGVPGRWAPYVFSDRVDTRLLPPKHGDASGVRGAAWLWSDAEAGVP